MEFMCVATVDGVGILQGRCGQIRFVVGWEWIRHLT